MHTGHVVTEPRHPDNSAENQALSRIAGYVFSIVSTRCAAKEPQGLQELSPGQRPGLEATNKILGPVRAA